MLNKYIFVALRTKHWLKNFIIFLPLIFGRQLFVFPANLKTIAAFFLFSLTASSVYLINDVIDIEKDKAHPSKRLRPIPSNKIGIDQAVMTASILAAISMTCSFLLNVHLGYLLLIYFGLNFLYMIIFKDLVILDVFCLGGFFLLRIIVGSTVAGVGLSHWIIIMTALLALFLGFNKRRQELRLLGEQASQHRHVFTKYNLHFIDQMTAIITSSIVIAYMLYTVDVRTVGQFGTRDLLYSIPFVYYGIFRYLYLIHKNEGEGDPTQILLSDRMLQLNIILWLIVCTAIIY